ncbi:DUF4132 domain-containing protein [Gordonia sp. ABSL1-1]|uniref:DUF4132 domain-containing protein n=1 Tax=Gordonia sp. ABSL1-1 TaxID=3053923 RepID=UPI002573A71F|nr:DUF4132 domain-containing protein [Gordonia sp. ABSL1-1]MDL9936584.1 DUF4132 domain-containing protein [Gordonia sp. ABSL1-1]
MALFRRADRTTPTTADREFIAALRRSIATDPAIADPDERQAIADRVADQLRTGTDPEVAAAIARAHGGWWSSSYLNDTVPDLRHRAYALLDQVTPIVARRWAQVLTGYRASPPTLTPVAGDHGAERLIDDIAKCFRHRAGFASSGPLPVHLATLDAIVVAGGGRPGELLEAVFSYDTTFRYAGLTGIRNIIRDLPDFEVAVAADSEVLAALAARQPAKARTVLLELFDGLADAALAPFADVITAALVGTSVTTAVAAEKSATRCPADAMIESLKRAANEGDSSTQIRALRAIWKLGPTPDDRRWAIDFAARATSAAAKALAREWAHRVTQLPTDADTLSDTTGTRTGTPAEWRIEITPSLRDAITRFVRDIGHPDADADLVRALTSGRRPATDRRFRDLLPYQAQDAIVPALTALWRCPDMTPTATLITLQFMNLLRIPSGAALSTAAVEAIEAGHADRPGFDLAHLQLLLDTMGLPGADLLVDAYRMSWKRLGHDWPAADVAPFAAANRDRFVAALADDTSYSADPTAPFRAFATLPALPADLTDTLFRIALGSSSRTRVTAQDVLVPNGFDVPADRIGRIHTAVCDPAADTRAVAATWLGRIGAAGADSPDVEVIESAYATERTERVLQAQLNALAALGRSPDVYLNRVTLAAQVAKAARKGGPPGLDWLDVGALPPVRWADDGEPVPVETLRWLLGTAVRLKDPEPTVALRYYCALFDATDRARLGDHLLDTWLVVGSIKTKGVLAICASCCTDNAAPIAEHYIRTNYGLAAAQCKALLAMLSWVDADNAVQTLLAISTRFRTRGIQEVAGMQVRALAQRRGWTPDQLADRTVPDGGFSTGGRLLLDYGPREFSARIGPGLTLALFNPDGKPVKSLPAPRATDDPEAVAASKRRLTAARKAVKTTVVAQRDRLYEAMCTERRWSVVEWSTYLRPHPIVGQLAGRLIWLAVAGDEHPIAFRPLDDGSLTDADDEEVQLQAEATISLVHPGALAPAAVTAWRTHLVDYEVDPLFDQLGEPIAIDDVSDAATSYDGYEGYLLDAFTLRAATTRRGYLRGPTGDGGIVTSYVKRFPSSGIEVVLGFSGIALPEENLSVALTHLHFTDVSDGGNGRWIRFGDVPAVLLRESIGDLASVAALGAHDPNWRGKVRIT